MAESLRVWIKKVFSLTLLLNALITIAAITGILYGYYHTWRYWKPYAPYLVSGDLFLVVGIAALINIFPSASIGRKLHTGRFLFHHYMYGFFVLITSSIYLIAFTSASLITLFLVNSSNIAVNAGRCFVLIGFTLLLDDLPDTAKWMEKTLNKIKSGFCRIRLAMHYLQLATGVVTLYVFLAMTLSVIAKSSYTISNYLTLGTMLITSITSFACVKRKAWLQITPPSSSAAILH
jgi:hypothetical protein